MADKPEASSPAVAAAPATDTDNPVAAPASAVAKAPVSNAPAKPPPAEPLTRDDFVRARNCLLFVGLIVVAGIVAIVVLNSGSSAFVKFPPAIVEQMQDGMFVPIATGTTMFARLEGRRAEHVLLIHGSLGASYSWRKVIPYLRNVHSLRVVSFDLLGFGLSDKPKTAPYTVQHMADQVRDLLLFLQVPPVHVVAHDIGVDVALQFAANNAHWVRSLTLLNPVRATTLETRSFLSTLTAGFLAYLPHLQAKFTVWSAVQSSSISSTDLDTYSFLLAYKNGYDTYVKAIANINSSSSHARPEDLKQIPVQLVWGVVDAVDKAELAKFKATFSPKHVIELPVSHFVQEDNAERVAQSIATFISELPATPLPPEEAPRPPVYSDPMGGHGHSHGGHGHSHGGHGHSHGSHGHSHGAHDDMVMEEEDDHHDHGHGHSHGAHGHAH